MTHPVTTEATTEGGAPVRRPGRRALRRLAAVAALLAGAIAGCSAQTGPARAAEAECSIDVIVGFSPPVDARLLAELERAHELKLEPRGTLTAGLRVYRLVAAGADEACAAAVERLRRDERVRSVDVDARREVHDQ